MGAEELLKQNASDTGEVNGAEYGVKTAVPSHLNARGGDKRTREPRWL